MVDIHLLVIVYPLDLPHVACLQLAHALHPIIVAPENVLVLLHLARHECSHTASQEVADRLHIRVGKQAVQQGLHNDAADRVSRVPRDEHARELREGIRGL